MQEDEISEVSISLQKNRVSQPLAQFVKNFDSVPLKNNSKSTTTSSSSSTITVINVATENIKHSSREQKFQFLQTRQPNSFVIR
jgi:hypothetical protein